MGKSVSGTADGGEAAVEEFFQGIKAVVSFHIGIRRKDCKYLVMWYSLIFSFGLKNVKKRYQKNFEKYIVSIL